MTSALGCSYCSRPSRAVHARRPGSTKPNPASRYTADNTLAVQPAASNPRSPACQLRVSSPAAALPDADAAAAPAERLACPTMDAYFPKQHAPAARHSRPALVPSLVMWRRTHSLAVIDSAAKLVPADPRPARATPFPPISNPSPSSLRHWPTFSSYLSHPGCLPNSRPCSFPSFNFLGLAPLCSAD